MTATANNTSAPITADAAKNDKRLPDLFKVINKLGEEASLGKDSLPKLAHAVVKAAADGVIDATTKDAKGNDSAALIYERYAKAEQNKAIHDFTAGGFKANVSKLRQLITFGCMNTVDAVEVMQEAFEAREGMKREEGVKLKSAYPYYVDVAREQLKSDKPLTKAQLEEISRKPSAAPKELEAELEAIKKRLENLVTGEGKSGLKDTDPLTEAAFQAIRERLDGIAKDRATMALRQQAAKLGIKLA